jgi:NADPH:quinone reductase-like Zn-dependent oxidoreductase
VEVSQDKKKFVELVEQAKSGLLTLPGFQRCPKKTTKRSGPNGSYFLAGGSVATIFQILLLGAWIRASTGKRIRILAVQPNTEDVDLLKELIEAGKVTPIIDKTFPLSEVPEAIGYVGEGRANGKVVITV